MIKHLLFQNKIIYIFIIFFSISYNINAQDVQKNLITLKSNTKNLPQLLESITQQTQIRFSYNPDILNHKNIIAVDFKNKEIDDVLKSILPKNLTYQKKGKYIIISPIINNNDNNINKNKEEIISKNTTEVKKDNQSTKRNNQLHSDLATNLKNIPISNNGKCNITCHNYENQKIEEKMRKYIATLLIGTSIVNFTLGQKVSTPSAETSKVETSEQIVYVNVTEPIVEVDVNVAEPTVKVDVTESVVEVIVPEFEELVSDSIKSSHKPFQLSLVYPIGIDWVNSRNNNYNMSLNLIGGITGQVNGIEIGSVFNVNKYNLNGVQISGAVNITGFNPNNALESNNTQIAGLLNYTRTGFSTQIAGAINYADKSPVQISGLFNHAKEANIQISGAINTSNKSNFQISGLTNIAKTSPAQGEIDIKPTVQISGAVNIATESSCQIGGLLNITKKGKFQLGLINIRDTTDGVSIGLLNIAKKGGFIDFGVEANEMVHTALTLRSGSSKLYSMISLGYKFTSDLPAGSNMVSFGYGLGTTLYTRNKFSLNLELSSNRLIVFGKSDIFPSNPEARLIQLRPIFNYKLANHLKIYAAPSFNFLFERGEHKYSTENGEYSPYFKTPYSIFNTNFDIVDIPLKLDFWIGGTIGIKF